MNIPSCHWSRHGFDMNAKIDHVTNNMTESFNSQIDKYMCEPILTLLEALRRKMMKNIQKRNQLALTWKGVVPPSVQAAIDKAGRESRNLNIIFEDEKEYEIWDENKTKAVVVKLNDFWCQCGSWQINGIPCKHAMRYINSERYDSAAYVHLSLTKEAYLQTYTSMIHLIPNEALWPKVDFDHGMTPIIKRKPGRPRREADEPAKEKGLAQLNVEFVKLLVIIDDLVQRLHQI